MRQSSKDLEHRPKGGRCQQWDLSGRVVYRMREPMLPPIPEFPRNQHEMEVMFQDVGRAAAFMGHRGSLAPLLEGVGRGVFRDGWRGWSCRWAVRTAGQPHLD